MGSREIFIVPKLWTLIGVFLIICPCVIKTAGINDESPQYSTISPITETTMQPEECTENREKNTFSWVDYLIVAIMLIASCGIGLFYGFFGEKQTTSDDFLLGGSSMGTFPMAISLGASFITAIELLGNPAEMYTYGSQFWLICSAFIFVVPITSRLYLPVYMKLRLTSSFEYLELRFGQPVRIFASGLYVLQMVLYTSVAVYAPALALSNVTGLNTYIAVAVIYLVCIFYSCQGGMKAVIITDTFQFVVLIGSILAILGLGEYLEGGYYNIWTVSDSTNRMEFFKLNPDPTIRHSFWSVVIGGTFYWTTMYCANQASIQKYLSVEKISQARIALWVSCVILVGIFSVNFYTGMILVARYKDCDPILENVITAADQILPLYVIDVLGYLQGMPGFFVAGIFAASLGTVASALTSVAAVTCQDFIVGAFQIKLADNKGALVARWISLIFGVVSFALVFLVEQLGSVLQVALSFNGMVGGVTLGLFSLGMFIPFANTRGALFGGIVAFAIVLWIGIGGQIAIAQGLLYEIPKETTTNNCPCLNETIIAGVAEKITHSDDGVLSIYKISYLWYSVIGSLVTLVFGIIVSLITKGSKEENIPSDLLSPPILNIFGKLPAHVRDWMNCPSSAASTYADADRKNSVMRMIGSVPKKDMERKRRLSQQNGGVFYSICITDGKFSETNKYNVHSLNGVNTPEETPNKQCTQTVPV